MVPREQLTRRLWPEGTFVDAEVGLNSAMMKLRDALGDSAANPRFIETLPRRGYRFIGVVERITEARKPLRAVVPVAKGEASEAVPPQKSSKMKTWWAALGVCALAVGIAGTRKGNPIDGVTGTSASEGVRMDRLTRVGDCDNAVISPSGEFVAYSRDEGGRQSLWLKQIATGKEQQLIATRETQYWGLTFSPDGAYVYYVASEEGEGGGPRTQADLYRIALIGGEASKLKENLDSPISLLTGRPMVHIRAGGKGRARKFVDGGTDG